jgi:hypothetical protein
MSSTSVEPELKYVNYTFAGRKKVINTAVPRLHRTPFQPLYIVSISPNPNSRYEVKLGFPLHSKV